LCLCGRERYNISGKKAAGSQLSAIVRDDMALKGKILVVDDEASVRDLLDSVFTEAGHEVVPAEGGKQALAVLKIHGIDVIFWI
jgi:PleD family two-component response regulator